MGHDLALHELAHWRVQAVNVTMHGQLEGPLCLIPLWEHVPCLAEVMVHGIE